MAKIKNYLCSVEGCNQFALTRGYCASHYRKWNLYGDPLKQLKFPQYKNQGKVCKIVDCDLPAFAKELCKAHHNRWERLGDAFPTKPLKKLRQKGAASAARTLTKNGYIQRYFPEHPNAAKGGAIFEHVLVMSEHLGRPLYKDETVHHKNGVRDDNQINNLELWSSSHPNGQRVEDKVVWAEEILKRYL